jgi:hypothetical protein
MWMSILRQSSVRIILTTYPASNWTNALLYASRQLGIHCVYMQQGLPASWLSILPNCTAAVVWSHLGSATLRANGFSDRPVIIARNPSIPEPEIVATLRTRRRKELGLAAGDLCVLVLGQKSVDQVFVGKGYRETCNLVGRGLAIAVRSGRVIPFLRPHYGDLTGETERALRQHELPILLMSKDSPLQEDIAAADVVLSMHSTAMEEAYLMGRPLVQTVADGVEPVLDFGLLGAPLVRSSVELARCLASQDWFAGRRQPPVCRSVADEIRDMLDSEQPRAQVRVSTEDTSIHEGRHGNHASFGRDNPSTVT